MLHIIGVILKIIGIVLLTVLGLLLAVLLLALLVPVRYRLSGSYHEKPAGGVDVSWLFRAVVLSVTYEDGLMIAAKLLGRKVFQTGGAEAEDEAEEWTEDAWDEAEDALREAADGGEKTAENASGAENTDPADAGARSQGQELLELPDVVKDGDGGRPAGEGSEGPELQATELDRPAGESSKAGRAADESADGLSAKDETAEEHPGESGPEIRAGETGAQGEDRTEEESQVSAAEEPGLEDRIEALFSKISEKLKWAEGKRRWGMRFINDSRNRKVFALLWRQVKALLRHVLPRKARGRLVLGFEDPAVTGQVLAACSVFYALYGDDLTVTPDFEDPVIDGELEIKGRVRLGVIAVLAARVLIDRNFWRMIKQVRRFLAKGEN